MTRLLVHCWTMPCAWIVGLEAPPSPSPLPPHRAPAPAAGGGVNSSLRTRWASTTLISNGASVAPGQMRRPPPNGNMMLRTRFCSWASLMNRDGRKSSGRRQFLGDLCTACAARPHNTQKCNTSNAVLVQGNEFEHKMLPNPGRVGLHTRMSLTSSSLRVWCCEVANVVAKAHNRFTQRRGATLAAKLQACASRASTALEQSLHPYGHEDGAAFWQHSTIAEVDVFGLHSQRSGATQSKQNQCWLGLMAFAVAHDCFMAAPHSRRHLRKQ